MATATANAKVRVLLLDDHTILRQGVARLLSAEPDFEVNLHCGSVGEALLIVGAGVVDLVILDLDLSGERGIDFLSQARKNGFTGPVMVLTANVPQEEEAELRGHGISGILRKDASIEMLAPRLREAIGSPAPRLPVAPLVAAGGATPPGRPARPFTAREGTVLRLVVEGLANKEIAGELGCSENVVKAVVQQLFKKTGTHTHTRS